MKLKLGEVKIRGLKTSWQENIKFLTIYQLSMPKKASITQKGKYKMKNKDNSTNKSSPKDKIQDNIKGSIKGSIKGNIKGKT